jgi:hypothetical protein
MFANRSLPFMDRNNRVAIVVISCDKFSSLWYLFFERLERFWPDFDGKVYLVSNFAQANWKQVTTICVGTDADWSSNLSKALEQVEEENLLLMLEDAPLNRAVDHEEMLRIFEDFQRDEFEYLNLKASPSPRSRGNERYLIYPPDLMYRAALVPCIWKKRVLSDLIVLGESAWQFEIRGSVRSAKYHRFFSVPKPVIHFLHCVIQGKLDRRAARTLTKTGEIDALQFPKMSRYQYASLRVKELRGEVFSIVPSWLSNRIRRFYFKKIKGRQDWV